MHDFISILFLSCNLSLELYSLLQDIIPELQTFPVHTVDRRLRVLQFFLLHDCTTVA